MHKKIMVYETYFHINSFIQNINKRKINRLFLGAAGHFPPHPSVYNNVCSHKQQVIFF